ncbi:glycosyltransferase family 4 protein [bacterium]|nr:glycosyltransferase family 4 protein [bacterium]
MKKILIIGPTTHTIVNFRGDLIKEMTSRGHQVVAIGPEKGFEEEIKSFGARFIHLPMQKTSVGILHDLTYMKNLLKIFKIEKPDVLFSYAIKPVIYGSISAKLASVKERYSMITGLGYVFTTKNFKTKILTLIVGLLYRLGFACSHKVIFQNEDDMNDFLQAGYVSKNKTSLVNGSGVNMNKFTPTPLPKTLTFLMIARVLRNKGVVEYLEAARKLKNKYPDIKFVLLGAIEKLQDSLKYDDIRPYIDDTSIEYYKETRDVRPYLAQSSVFVLPSYREGTPRTVLEAMACGRPVITTNVPGCRQTVVNGINGFLVPVKDINALAEKMEWFINNSEKIKEMGEASYNICKEKYDVEKVNKEMLKLLNLI